MVYHGHDGRRNHVCALAWRVDFRGRYREWRIHYHLWWNRCCHPDPRYPVGDPKRLDVDYLFGRHWYYHRRHRLPARRSAPYPGTVWETRAWHESVWRWEHLYPLARQFCGYDSVNLCRLDS